MNGKIERLLEILRITIAQKSNESHHVLIVWLRKEFKERVSRKRQIELTAGLTTALKRLDEQVSDEDQTEEDKIVSEVPSVLYRKHLVDILLGREPDKAVGKELLRDFFRRSRLYRTNRGGLNLPSSLAMPRHNR